MRGVPADPQGSACPLGSLQHSLQHTQTTFSKPVSQPKPAWTKFFFFTDGCEREQAALSAPWRHSAVVLAQGGEISSAAAVLHLPALLTALLTARGEQCRTGASGFPHAEAAVQPPLHWVTHSITEPACWEHCSQTWLEREQLLIWKRQPTAPWALQRASGPCVGTREPLMRSGPWGSPSAELSSPWGSCSSV